MKLIANHTIGIGKGRYIAPGEEFDLADADAQRLLTSGAAKRKTRTVPVADDPPRVDDPPEGEGNESSSSQTEKPSQNPGTVTRPKR